jgi:hypothetical protein
LSRIEKYAFFGAGLIEIIVPSSVEVLGEECFCDCESVSSVTFEAESRLLQSKEKALIESGFRCEREYPTS